MEDKTVVQNLEYYESARSVPKEAQKTIQAGRLKGMTDVNPMWRIKKMTEMFGPCGQKWGIDDEKVIRWTDDGPDGTRLANVQISVRIRYPDGSSEPIVGIGGAYLIAKEKEGLRLDDEAWKKAYTDAQSTAFKLIGVAADIYFAKDTTKYTSASDYAEDKPKRTSGKPAAALSPQIQVLADIVADLGYDLEDVRAICQSKLDTTDIETLSKENYERLKNYLIRLVEKTKQEAFAN